MRGAAAATLLALGVAGPAAAVGTLQLDETRSLSVDVALRGSVEVPQPPGRPTLQDEFAVLALSGVALPWLHLQANFAGVPTGVQVLDAIVEVEPDPRLKLWAGHLLPPGDRTNFSGPFFLDTWDLPYVSRYQGQFAGRDDGAVLWGELFGGKFKYHLGAFAGRRGATTSNPAGVPEFTGRVVWEFLDTEPGYYNMSTYFGARDILALGLGARYQAHGAGTPGQSGAFGAYDADLLFEKRFGGFGAVTLDAALYRYDTGGVADPALVQGNAGMVLAGYLLPMLTGPGRLQPTLRYQALRLDAGGTHQRYDAGFNYVLNGHFSCLALGYFLEQTSLAAPWTHGIKLGAEIVL